eukprot:11413404-Alexandrium_andersonii.AAC.1
MPSVGLPSPRISMSFSSRTLGNVTMKGTPSRVRPRPMKLTVCPWRSLPVSLARKRAASVILELAMETSSGPAV